MELVIINNPATIGWQANLLDLVLLVMFASAVVYAIAQWRRGVRAYVTLLVAAFFYGVVLELGGMALLNMYVQGDFTVMLNFRALAPFQGTTAMPFYVLIFYPVFLFTGFKVVEAWGITRRWQAAVTGGLFMVAFDAPYIIEGGLRHVVWWTWRSDFPMFQYWLDWPLVDLCWQATWDAMFFYLMLWALPHIDRRRRGGRREVPAGLRASLRAGHHRRRATVTRSADRRDLSRRTPVAGGAGADPWLRRSRRYGSAHCPPCAGSRRARHGLDRRCVCGCNGSDGDRQRGPRRCIVVLHHSSGRRTAGDLRVDLVSMAGDPAPAGNHCGR